MNHRHFPFLFLVFAFLLSSGVQGQRIPAPLENGVFRGEVVQDQDRLTPGGQASLRLAPGTQAIYSFRDGDGSGKVEIQVYDDGGQPAKAKVRRGGPHVGVVTSTGRVMAVGQVYAPYLSPAHYTVTEYEKRSRVPWAKVQYLGIKRQKGWQTWTFDFDAGEGFTLLLNGKKVSRYDWNRSEVGGFAGVILVGDQGGGAGQTLWVGEVSVNLGEPMRVKPEAPPPPPPVVPAKDPQPEGILTGMDVERMRSHPRLLFTAADLPALREKQNSPGGRLIWKQLEQYLPASRPPKTPAFTNDDTDAQRHGLWRLPTVALHALLTGDEGSLQDAIGYMRLMMATEDWQKGRELNSGMGAANVLVGAALAYDWLYQDLDPAFREAFRQKLILQARRMYYGGHLNGNKAVAYWQGDPQNNHRWHRNAGLTLAALAAFEGSDQETWLLETAFKELDYVMKWRPEDGSYSEGPGYMIFGGVHLMLALAASDLNLGTEFEQHPFIRNNGRFILQTLLPDRKGVFPFNDTAGNGGLSGYAVYLHRNASLFRDQSLQFLLNEAWREQAKGFTHIAWLALIWHDPDLAEGKLSDFPTRAFYRDSGVAFVRDGWSADSVAAMFRCMPPGGLALNKYRNANGYKYVNVAHDDPDANSFVLWKQGGFVAETSRYSSQKQSANHNTILINGLGQAPVGRGPDPVKWLQPAKNADMLEMASVTDWQAEENVVIIEGEAAGAYTATRSRAGIRRPSLSRYRRTFIWVESRYVLVLDDIRAEEDVDLTWLMQAPGLDITEAEKLRFQLGQANATCPFQVASLSPLGVQVVESPADHRGKALGWKQLRLSARGRDFRLASVYDLWGRGGLRVNLTQTDAGVCTVQVSGNEINEIWTWIPAAEADQASKQFREFR